MKRFLVFCLALLFAGCAGEPKFEGRPAKYWRQQLKANDYMARWRACCAFTYIGPPAKEGIPELITCLGDSEHLVRNEATLALSKMGPEAKAAVPKLIELLKDPFVQVRHGASEALKKIDYQAWYDVKGKLEEEQ